MASNNTNRAFGANDPYSDLSLEAHSEPSSPFLSSGPLHPPPGLSICPPLPPTSSPAQLYRPAKQPPSPRPPAPLSPLSPLSPLPPMPRTYNPMKAKPLTSEREVDDGFEPFKLPPCQFADDPIGELRLDMRRAERRNGCNTPAPNFDDLRIFWDGHGAPSSSSVESVRGSVATAEDESVKSREEVVAAKPETEAEGNSFFAAQPESEYELRSSFAVPCKREPENRDFLDFQTEPKPESKGKEKAVTPPVDPWLLRDWTEEASVPQASPAAPSRGPDAKAAEQERPEADSDDEAGGPALPRERPGHDIWEKKWKGPERWALPAKRLSELRAQEQAEVVAAAVTSASLSMGMPVRSQGRGDVQGDGGKRESGVAFGSSPRPLVAYGSNYASKKDVLSEVVMKNAKKHSMGNAKSMDDVKSRDRQNDDFASRFVVAEIPPFRGKKDVESKGKAKENLSLEQIQAELELIDKRVPAVQEEEFTVSWSSKPSLDELEDAIMLEMLEHQREKSGAQRLARMDDKTNDDMKKKIADEAKKTVDVANKTLDEAHKMVDNTNDDATDGAKGQEKNKAQLKKPEKGRATLEEIVNQQAVEKTKIRAASYFQSPARSARLPNGLMLKGNCKGQEEDEMERMIREMEEENARHERLWLEIKDKGKEESRPFLASTRVSNAKDSKYQKDLETETQPATAAAIAGPSGASASASGARSASASASASTPTFASASSQTTASASASANAATNTEQKSRVADAIGKLSEMPGCLEAMRNTEERLLSQIAALDARMKKDTRDINAMLAELEARKANAKDTLQVPRDMGPGTFIPWDRWNNMSSSQRQEFVQRWVPTWSYPASPGQTTRPMPYPTVSLAELPRAELSGAWTKKETQSPSPPPSPAVGYGRGSPASARGPDNGWMSAANSTSPTNNIYARQANPAFYPSQNPSGYAMFGDQNPQVPHGYARWGYPQLPVNSRPPQFPVNSLPPQFPVAPVPGQRPHHPYRQPYQAPPSLHPTNPVHPARGRGQSTATTPSMRPGNHQPTYDRRPIQKLPTWFEKMENAKTGADEYFRDPLVDELAARLGKCTLTSSADTTQATQASSAVKEAVAETAPGWRARIEGQIREADAEARARRIAQEAVDTAEQDRGDAPASEEAARGPASVEKTDVDEKSRHTESARALVEEFRRSTRECAEQLLAGVERSKAEDYEKRAREFRVENDVVMDDVKTDVQDKLEDNVEPEVEPEVEDNVEPETEEKVEPEVKPVEVEPLPYEVAYWDREKYKSDEDCEDYEDEDYEDEEYEEEVYEDEEYEDEEYEDEEYEDEEYEEEVYEEEVYEEEVYEEEVYEEEVYEDEVYEDEVYEDEEYEDEEYEDEVYEEEEYEEEEIEPKTEEGIEEERDSEVYTEDVPEKGENEPKIEGEIEPKIEEEIEPKIEEEIEPKVEVEAPEVEAPEVEALEVGASEVEEEIESDTEKVEIEDLSDDSWSSDSEPEYLFV